MNNKPYINEEGRVETPDLPDDYDQTMQNACDHWESAGHWENSDETKDAHEHDDHIHPGGSLKERYECYHDMALTCGEEPVSFGDWLN